MRAVSRTVPGLLVRLRPFGVLDNQLAVRVDRLAFWTIRFSLTSARRSVRIAPSCGPPCFPALLAGAVGEKPVVQDDLVKKLCRVFHGLDEVVPHLLIGIAVRCPQSVLVPSSPVRSLQVGWSGAGDLHIVFPDTRMSMESAPRDHQPVPVGLQIDLVAAAVGVKKRQLAARAFSVRFTMFCPCRREQA